MRLAVIPGDGIGPEVIDEALKVLTEVVPDVATTPYDLGAARWHATGELLPESVLTELGEHDAILLGAVGDPSVPARLAIRAPCLLTASSEFCRWCPVIHALVRGGGSEDCTCGRPTSRGNTAADPKSLAAEKHC